MDGGFSPWVLLASVAIGTVVTGCQENHVPSTSRERAVTKCQAPDDYAHLLRNSYSAVVADADSTVRVLLMLPLVDDSLITFVSDSVTCARAARSYAIAAGQDTVDPPALILFRVGPTRFVGSNGEKAGEFLVSRVFDSSFVWLKSRID